MSTAVALLILGPQLFVGMLLVSSALNNVASAIRDRK